MATSQGQSEPQPVRTLSVLIPVFNSEETIGPLIDDVVTTLSPHFERLEIVAVNDGSGDRSHDALVAAHRRHPEVLRYVRLARNFGEHNAVMCGLHHATCEAAAIIDDDFQNPPAEILHLTGELAKGFDVVYSRYEVKQHRWWRNLGSRFNDWVATRLLGKPEGLYLSSFKVMNRFLIDTVVGYEGPFPYIDGLILRSTDAIGSRLCAHRERQTGTSNYTLGRLIKLWLNMFTSFSVVPLRVSTFLGLLMSGVGVLLTIFFVISWSVGGVFLHERLPPGWASTIIVITVFAGIQLLMLGMIGEYVGRIFLTHNRHPQFVVRESYAGDEGRAGTETGGEDG